MSNEEHEPNWMRDKRLKDEEARMVRVEEDLSAIKRSSEATHELLIEERKARRAAEEALLKHEGDDTTKFASIDSRLQGTQTQLSTTTATLERIEKKLDGVTVDTNNRLKALEDGETGRTAVQRFLGSAWTHMAAGGSIVAALAGLYKLAGG